MTFIAAKADDRISFSVMPAKAGIHGRVTEAQLSFLPSPRRKPGSRGDKRALAILDPGLRRDDDKGAGKGLVHISMDKYAHYA